MNDIIKAPSGFLLIFCIILITSFSQSCVSARARSMKKGTSNAWHIAKEEKSENPSWTIFTRKIANTNFLEYKIEGDIPTTPEACVSSFRQDIDSLAAGSESKKYPVYNIVDESEDSLLTYVIHNEPFPLHDTEMSVRYLFFNDADGHIGVRWHEAWDVCPIQPSKKLNRVQTFRGAWYFSSISPTKCKALNSVQFDPKKMPMWLVEPMVFNFLKKGLEDLRKKAAGGL
ncbi:MAG: hypothetical protein AB8F95_12835 [Bacteroidia bacterium]